MAWSEYKQRRMVTLKERGLSISEIAEEMSEDYNVVHYRCQKSGFSKPRQSSGAKWTDEQVAELRKLWRDGLSASQIAAQLKVTRNAVIGKVHRLGLPARTKPEPRGPHMSKAAKACYRKLTTKPTAKYYPTDLNLKPMEKAAAVELGKMLNPPRPAKTVPLIEIADTQCRYPYRKNGEPVCCGKPVVPGTKWCRDCYGRTHKKDSAGPKARHLEAAE